ncbi:hypothetical protein DVT68_16990 [Dyella solisilvae]|uniref:Uncharacterized protein n=1 Tax=Dyella solisilvae TaxID=1920168 RepID=A0A370K5Z4_9GAMM|nr:hypothetical protein [Dyella solisilvae]RDI97440.1 hypothetical protein DVT68_16990 [Dyella solisilvae]
MADDPKVSRKEYFADHEISAASSCAFAREVKERMDAVTGEIVSRDNVQHFRHGGAWQHPANPDAVDGGMKTHSALTQTSFDEIINHDLGSIERALNQVTESMTQGFFESLYSLVSDSCTSVGNVVSARDGVPVWELLYEVFEKIELSVDRDGEVHMPQLHVGSEDFSNFNEKLKAAPPEFHQRFRELQTRKVEEARIREANRRSKFTRYGNAG